MILSLKNQIRLKAFLDTNFAVLPCLGVLTWTAKEAAQGREVSERDAKKIQEGLDAWEASCD